MILQEEKLAEVARFKNWVILFQKYGWITPKRQQIFGESFQVVLLNSLNCIRKFWRDLYHGWLIIVCLNSVGFPNIGALNLVQSCKLFSNRVFNCFGNPVRIYWDGKATRAWAGGNSFIYTASFLYSLLSTAHVESIQWLSVQPLSNAYVCCGELIALAFTMQGVGSMAGSLTLLAMIYFGQNRVKPCVKYVAQILNR